MKVVTSSALALLFTIACFSSSRSQVTFAVGPKFGINFANISASVDQTQDPFAGGTATDPNTGRTGMMMGAAFEIGFGRMFALQVEPMYTMKGSTRNNQANNFFNTGGTVTHALSYLDIPVGFKVKFLDGPFHPYVMVGPSIGFLLSATDKSDNTQNQGGFGNGTNGDTDVSNSVSGVDFGVFFGTGTEYRLSHLVALTFDARYSLGISNLVSTTQQNQFTGAATGATEHSRGFQLILGTLFYVGK